MYFPECPYKYSNVCNVIFDIDNSDSMIPKDRSNLILHI